MTDIDIETRLRSDEPAEAADLWLLNLEGSRRNRPPARRYRAIGRLLARETYPDV